MSSLDTLLQAADYLERLERAGSTDAKRASINGDGLAGGHLFLDPNLPISFQFHTYSSLTPTNGNHAATAPITIAANGHHVHHGQNGGGLLLPGHPTSNSEPNRHGYLASNNNGLGIGAGQQHHSASTKSHKNNAGSLTANTTPVRPTGTGGRGRGRGTSESSDKDSVASSRHRELHKTLEKNRRAHLRHCFEQLKTELPKSEYNDKKTSHINIIHCAIRYIQTLKRMEYENEHEIERLARIKIRYQNQLKQTKEELLQRPNGLAMADIETLLSKSAARIAGSAPASLNSLNGSSTLTSVINIKRESGGDKSVITSAGSSPLSSSNSSPPSMAAASLKSLSLSTVVQPQKMQTTITRSAIPTSVVVPNSSATVLALAAAAAGVRQGSVVGDRSRSGSSGSAGSSGLEKSEDETNSDTNGDVIVELETGEEYDDSTTTASECADDVRDLCPPVRGRFGGLVTAEHAIHA